MTYQNLERWKHDIASGAPIRRPRVVIAEDDEELRRLLGTVLRSDGYDVIEASSGFELLELIGDMLLKAPGSGAVDLIITDVRMPGANGLDVVDALRRARRDTPVVVITAFGDEGVHRQGRRLGVAAMFDKPFDLDDFRMAMVNLVPRQAA